MKRTPPEISRARQEIGQEIGMWKAKLLETQNPQQAVFIQKQLTKCRKRMASLRKQGAHRPWSFKD